MGLSSLIITVGLASAQGRVVPAPCAALGALLWLRDEDEGMLEKQPKGAGGSGRDAQPRGASQTTWLAWLFLAFFLPLSCLRKLRFPRKCRYRLRPCCQFSAGSVSFPGTWDYFKDSSDLQEKTLLRCFSMPASPACTLICPCSFTTQQLWCLRVCHAHLWNISHHMSGCLYLRGTQPPFSV